MLSYQSFLLLFSLFIANQHFNNKLNRDFAELVRHTESTIEHVLEDPPGFFGIFSWIGIARGFVGKAGELKRKRDESGIKSPVGSEYYANARIFYRNILDKAELAEQKYEQDRPSLDVTRRAVNDICTILVDSVSSSPTSSFLDWSGATVGGRDLDEHLADVLGKLSHHGFGTVLSVIRKIMKLYD